MPSSAAHLHQRFIDQLQEAGRLRDARVEAALRTVPRHLFLPQLAPDSVYTDEAVVLKRDANAAVISASSQPSMIATMLAQLGVREGDNILEIGTGTGYVAALLQHLAGDMGKVTSVELDGELVRVAHAHLQRVGMNSRVNVVQADGAYGYAPRAAYDRILSSVGVWDIPPAWTQQLKRGGIIVAPLWLNAFQVSAALHVLPDETLYSDDNVPCGFVQMRGAGAGPRVSRRMGSTSLVLGTNALDQIDMTALSMLLSDDRQSGYLGMQLSVDDYWFGVLPYLLLRLPKDYLLILYSLLDDLPVFGLEQPGFALLSPGSACFVPYAGDGQAHGYGAADAFILMQEILTMWHTAGRPNASRLRVRLVGQAAPAPAGAFVEQRQTHQLQVWYAADEAAPTANTD